VYFVQSNLNYRPCAYRDKKLSVSLCVFVRRFSRLWAVFCVTTGFGVDEWAAEFERRF
jgi:hypothetical protein